MCLREPKVINLFTSCDSDFWAALKVLFVIKLVQKVQLQKDTL